MAFHQEKIAEQIQHLAAEFLQGESNKTSLITVTDVRMSSDLKRATIGVTVFPEEKEVEALRFVGRKEADLKKYMKAKTRLRHIPFLTFALDKGEKNRQAIDALT